MKSTALFEKKKVLVTGGAGFIGSHLSEKLVSYGAQLTVLDNLSTGTLSNLESILPEITFIEGDIRNRNDTDKATAQQDYTFHLAAQISVAQSIENPSMCYETNVIGTLNLLRSCVQNKCKSFIFSSSAAVYGDQGKIPCHENMICKPLSPYGTSKLLGEQLCNYYNQQFGITSTALRYFNVYGTRQDGQNAYAAALAKFRHNMQLNQPITIFGDGLQSRDFVSVDTVVQANILMASAQTSLVAGKIFNIGSGTSKTVLSILEELKAEYPHFNVPYHFLAARDGDIQHSAADCSRYINLVNRLTSEAS